MKWIELIRVRSTRRALLAVMPSLQDHVQELEESVPDAEPMFLQHALYNGDLAIVVVWRNDEAPRKTRAGLVLADKLRGLGALDHAVWIPTQPHHPED